MHVAPLLRFPARAPTDCPLGPACCAHLLFPPPPAPRSTLVVTEECLLHPSRNPHLGKEGIEKMLKEYLGLDKIIWLWKGMMGDDHVVNGHVDNMATFSEPGTILLSWCDDPNDPQHEVRTGTV